MSEVVSVQLYDFSQKASTCREYITRLETVKKKRKTNFSSEFGWTLHLAKSCFSGFFPRKYLAKIKPHYCLSPNNDSEISDFNPTINFYTDVHTLTNYSETCFIAF